MRKIDGCGMEKFGTLDIIVAMKRSLSYLQEIDGGHRRRNKKGILR